MRDIYFFEVLVNPVNLVDTKKTRRQMDRHHVEPVVRQFALILLQLKRDL